MDQDRAVHLTKLTMLLLGYPTESNIFDEIPSTDFMAVLACRQLTRYHLYIILNNMYFFGVFPSIRRGNRADDDVVNLYIYIYIRPTIILRKWQKHCITI